MVISITCIVGTYVRTYVLTDHELVMNHNFFIYIKGADIKDLGSCKKSAGVKRSSVVRPITMIYYATGENI